MPNVLTELVNKQAATYGSRVAVSHKQDNQWVQTSWEEFRDNVNLVAAALEVLGIKEQEAIAICSPNRIETLYTDFGAYANRAIPISIYSTSSLEQICYIVNDSGAKVFFAGDRRLYELARKALEFCPTIQQIVAVGGFDTDSDDADTITFPQLLEMGRKASDLDRAEVARRTAAATPEDIATIIYTSGTTGEPKGAMLPQSCFTAAIKIHIERLSTVSDRDVAMCFLPLSHIFEKAWNYFCLYRGVAVAINTDPHEIQDSIKQIRPSCMCSVPRFWEKVYTAIQDKFATIHGFRRWFANWALKIGKRRNIDYVRLGNKVPWWLEMRYRFAEQQLFKPLQRVIGVENGNIFPTAGAPLSPKIAEFFHTCGINVMIGYGLSETTATVTCFPRIGYEFGTVGTPIPDVHVKIAPDGEILVKGPTVMKGYHRKPEATAEAFTPDGWFRTGDAGYLDKSGALVLTERLKDLFKTSNGKYIAPQALESRLGEDRYIEQVATIGDRRKFVSALIVPDYAALRKYAAENGISFKTDADLAADPRINALIEKRIDTLLADLAPFERIKRFRLLSRPFTMENGELTNTLKIRRPVIAKRYADLIDGMYAD